ncbi:hypothetical protein HA402_006545 [Bradysia odoriphaga]|nr:hypothetical protein HA402_006545 [Bradysia odoriphaga]
MDNTGKLFGIYGNEQFMDHLYRYGKINNDVKKQGENLSGEEIERDIEKCGMHRITAVNICLTKIKSTVQGSEEWETYFDYIRWNQDALTVEFHSYLLQPCMEKHRGTISACHQLMNYVLDEFCKFTPADEAVISEYKHVYGMIAHARRQQPKKVLLQAGKLFVNFVDILTKRYFYKETADIQFADVQVEADVIIKTLSSDFPQQADTVKNVHENFVELRKMQDVYRVIQNDLLKKALKVAHARATENILQAAKRFLLNSICMVQQKLRDGLKTAIKIGEALVYPVIHPVETAKSIWYAIRHPVKAVKALGVWAVDNPWKCCAMVAGGLCLGAFALGGAAILFDLFIFDITATILTPLAVGGAIGGIMTPLAVAAKKAQQLVKKANDQVAGLKDNYLSLENNLKAEGDDIAIQAVDENLWFLLDEAEKPSATPDQLSDTMSEDELRQTERELNEQLPVIEDGLREAQSVVKATINDMSPDQQEASVIQRASEILKRRIADATTQ